MTAPSPLEALRDVLARATPGEWLFQRQTVYQLDETGNCNRFSALVQGGWAHRGAGRLGAGGDHTSEDEVSANAAAITASVNFMRSLLADDSPWVLAPRVPTPEMVEAGRVDIGCRRDCRVCKETAKAVYRAMLAALESPRS